MKLRPMTMDDADKMLEWKNYPETKNFSIVSHDEIKREDHIKWLKKNLEYFQVIDDNGLSCGAIRIKNCEISIWVDRKFRNKGIAKFFINQVAEPGMVAKIVNGNIASMRVFISAGFLPIGYMDEYYMFLK